MSKALQRLRWYETAEDCPDYCTILDDIRAGADELDALAARFDSAVNTLRDIADMGRKAGSESARHRLRELGIDCPDYGSMT